MISFYDGQLTDLLGGPAFKNDPRVQALSLTLRDGTRLLSDYTKRAYVYALIDQLEEPVLDLLATELKAQFYDTSYSIEIKRDLLKNANRWHMIAGTRPAVEELARSIFGECEVYEWFEYDGKPYHFEVITNAYADPQIIEKFNEILQNVKNLRSYLDAVGIHRTIDTKGSHSAAVVSTTVLQTKPIRCRL